VLYAGAAGISQVALLVAVAFWTWLWGPMGLLLATPLTSCVVVLGKHVPGLEFLSKLMADTPALSPDVAFYQRVLARDQSEAAELVENHFKNPEPDTIYDALLAPALAYAERDRLEDRLSSAEESAVVDTTRELMSDAAALNRAARAAAGEGEPDREPIRDRARPLRVAGYRANGAADELALRMLGELLEDDPITVEIEAARMLASDMIAGIRAKGSRVVCIADLPPSAPSKTRYLVKKLRAEFPDLHIVVGRWAPVELADESPAPLVEAGANHVANTLIETRDHLRGLVHLAVSEEPEESPAHA
jgi:hypothetical protein